MVDFSAQAPPDAGKMLVGYDLDGKLKQMDSTGAVTEIGSGGGGPAYVETTYADAIALAMADDLAPGTFYLITDFRTRHAIPETDPVEYWEEEVEPIVVLATSPNTISPAVWSTAFPLDVLEYIPKPDVYPGGDMGSITYRRSREGLEARYDWRGVKFRRWAVSSDPFSPGATYSRRDVAMSGVDGNLYMALRTTSGTDDPRADSDNWMLLLKIAADPYVCPYPDPVSGGWGIGGCNVSNLLVDAGDYEDYYTFGNAREPNCDYFANTVIEGSVFVS